jgi:hypothetical protein
VQTYPPENCIISTDYFSILISFLSHDSIPIITSVLYLSTNFRILKPYYKYFTVSLKCTKRLTLYPIRRYLSYSINSWPKCNFPTNKLLVIGPPSSCKVFCSSIEDRRVSLVFLVLWFPFSKICHLVLPADPPTSSPLTLAYSCPLSKLTLPSSIEVQSGSNEIPSSIQLFGSTKRLPPSRMYH